MERHRIMCVALTALLWAATATATPTEQQKCNHARVAAWGKFVLCVEAVLAREAKVGWPNFDRFKAFWKCRHRYYEKWTAFQTDASLAGSTCVGSRFVDNGNQTVTDSLSGLVWEKKDDAGGVHDKDNTYTWSTGEPYNGDGTAYAYFLLNINENSFGGANDWRIPTLAELQTIIPDFPCTGEGGGPTCLCRPPFSSVPCVDPALDAANTPLLDYWSGTSWVSAPQAVWTADFHGPYFYPFSKTTSGNPVRAVRGGL